MNEEIVNEEMLIEPQATAELSPRQPPPAAPRSHRRPSGHRRRDRRSNPRDGRDRVEKVADYAAFGVRYSWILDPEIRSLEILELGADGRYAHALGASEGTVENFRAAKASPSTSDALWAEIDRLAADDATT